MFVKYVYVRINDVWLKNGIFQYEKWFIDRPAYVRLLVSLWIGKGNFGVKLREMNATIIGFFHGICWS